MSDVEKAQKAVEWLRKFFIEDMDGGETNSGDTLYIPDFEAQLDLIQAALAAQQNSPSADTFEQPFKEGAGVSEDTPTSALGGQQNSPSANSCGCMFCDLGLDPDLVIEGVKFHHVQRRGNILCERKNASTLPLPTKDQAEYLERIAASAEYDPETIVGGPKPALGGLSEEEVPDIVAHTDGEDGETIGWHVEWPDGTGWYCGEVSNAEIASWSEEERETFPHRFGFFLMEMVADPETKKIVWQLKGKAADSETAFELIAALRSASRRGE
jgi:hypothetical protein